MMAAREPSRLIQRRTTELTQELLVARAAMLAQITWSDLLAEVETVYPWGNRRGQFEQLLADLGLREGRAGHGIITCLVVSDAFEPVPLFWPIARQLGRNLTGTLRAWHQERQIVYAHWRVELLEEVDPIVRYQRRQLIRRLVTPA